MVSTRSQKRQQELEAASDAVIERAQKSLEEYLRTKHGISKSFTPQYMLSLRKNNKHLKRLDARHERLYSKLIVNNLLLQ